MCEVQPIRSMSSGIGSVTTMKSVQTAKARRKCRSRAAQAPLVRTTWAARDGAGRRRRRAAGRPASTRSIGVPSKMRTPRSSSTRRSSRASLAGWSTVRSGVMTPPTKRGESATAPRLGGVDAPQPVGEAVLLEQAERLVVRPGLPLAGARVEDALVVRVDARLVARDPAVELVDHVGEGGGVGDPALLAERGAQARQPGPRRREEAAVGAAAPGAADVGLEEHDAEVRRARSRARRPSRGRRSRRRRRRRRRVSPASGGQGAPGSARRASSSHQLRVPTGGTGGCPSPLKPPLPSVTHHGAPLASLRAVDHPHATHHEGQA